MRIFALILATASGQQSKSERHGYGQSEFVPWQIGAVMTAPPTFNATGILKMRQPFPCPKTWIAPC